MTTLSGIKNIEMLYDYLSNHNLSWPDKELEKAYSANQLLVRSWIGHDWHLEIMREYSRFLVKTERYLIFPEWLKSQGIKMSLVSIKAKPISGEKGVYKLDIHYVSGGQISILARREAYDNIFASDEENTKNRIDDLSLLGIPIEKMYYFIPIEGGEKTFAFNVGGYYAIDS